MLAQAILVLALDAPALAGVELGVGGVGGGAFFEPQGAGGQDLGFTAAGSPLLSVQVDPWHGVVRPVFGLSSAPTFQYSMGYDAFSRPLLVAEAGVSAGRNATRVTLAGHAGLWSFGAGLRLTHVPWALSDSADTGFELRATWLARWGGYAGALWVVRLGGSKG